MLELIALLSLSAGFAQYCFTPPGGGAYAQSLAFFGEWAHTARLPKTRAYRICKET